MKMSATISSGCLPNPSLKSHKATMAEVAKARAKARASPRAPARAKALAKEDVEAL